jgi:hypothetical protein
MINWHKLSELALDEALHYSRLIDDSNKTNVMMHYADLVNKYLEIHNYCTIRLLKHVQ